MPLSDPDILPLLSRGRHRSPRKGACFMELASFLAGERWSDHPACTHPLLARLARGVNDATSDAGRPRLAVLIPSVIGLTSDDPRWDHAVAVVAASAALPHAPEERQRALAVGILSCDRLLAARVGDDGDPAGVRARGRAALADVPLAARWAERFVAQHGSGRLTRHPGTAVVDFSVQGIAFSGRADADDILRTLLTDAIAVCRALDGRAADADLPPTVTWPVMRAAVARA